METRGSNIIDVQIFFFKSGFFAAYFFKIIGFDNGVTYLESKHISK